MAVKGGLGGTPPKKRCAEAMDGGGSALGVGGWQLIRRFRTSGEARQGANEVGPVAKPNCPSCPVDA